MSESSLQSTGSVPPHQSTTAGMYPQRWKALAVLVVGLLVVILDNTILNVALKTIQEDLGATQNELVWAINAYSLAFAALLFTWGVMGDRFGRKTILLIGLVLFGLASALCAFATSPGELIAFRALMGIGGASVMPISLSIITVIFPPQERGKAIGVWAAAVGGAVALGPGPRRRAARAPELVPVADRQRLGLGLLHQRPDRHHRHHRHHHPGPGDQEPAPRQARSDSAWCCPSSACSRWSTASRTPRPTAGAPPPPGVSSSSACSILVGFGLYELKSTPPVDRSVAVQDPVVLGAADRRLAGLRRHAGHPAVPDVLLPDRPRLVAAAGRPAGAAVRRRPAARRPAQRQDGAAVRRPHGDHRSACCSRWPA